MGATTSRRKEVIPSIIKEFRDTEISGMVSYVGWYGVGTSSAAKAVAKAAEEHKLFDPVIFVTAGEECTSRPGKLQRRIAEKLSVLFPDHIRIDDDVRIDDDAEDDDEDDSGATLDYKFMKMIFKSLEGHEFLLVVDRLLERNMNFEEMGVPIPKPWSKSRILITTPLEYFVRDRRNYVLRLEDSANVRLLDFPGTTDDVLEQFREEACHIASSLVLQGTVISTDQVFHCFLYFLLFQNQQKRGAEKEEVMKYYIGEGFITLQQQEQERDGDGVWTAFKVGEAVLGEREKRRMLEKRPYGRHVF